MYRRSHRSRPTAGDLAYAHRIVDDPRQPLVLREAASMLIWQVAAHRPPNTEGRAPDRRRLQ